MRKVQEIYDEYRIMPGLATHQLRVASVAKLICDSFQNSINSQDVILACLFHDMGNIIKSNFDDFPDLFRGPQKRDYWERVKSDYIEKYGPDEHAASIVIAGELGLSENVRQYIEGVGFSKLEDTQNTDSCEQKICEYSDLRVGPYGILSLDGRITDIHERYIGRHSPEVPSDEVAFNQLAQAAHDVERQIFARSSIKPEDINDCSVASLVEELREYQLA